MTSGNFEVGKDLTLKGFMHYVAPRLVDAGCSVPDKLELKKDSRGFDGIVLISLVGAKDLESLLNGILIEAGNAAKNDFEAHRDYKTALAFEHQISGCNLEYGQNLPIRTDYGIFNTIGLYQDDETASKLFPSLAQDRLLEIVGQQAEKVGKKISKLLGQKLSDLV